MAALIAAGMPTRLYYTSYRNNAFDTHVLQNDLHQRLLTYTADAIYAFMQDMARIGRADDVVVMVFSEFGRRVPENTSLGTDHGTADPMFVIGKPVKGGHYGVVPSLTELTEGDNLLHTTDFRRVYATVVPGWLGYHRHPGAARGGLRSVRDVRLTAVPAPGWPPALTARGQETANSPLPTRCKSTYRFVLTFGCTAGLWGRAMTRRSLAQIGVDVEANGERRRSRGRSPGGKAGRARRSERHFRTAADDHFIARNGLRYAGSHLIIDLWDADHLDDVGVIELALRRAVKAAGATLLHLHLHGFAPAAASRGSRCWPSCTSRSTPGPSAATPRSTCSSAASAAPQRRDPVLKHGVQRRPDRGLRAAARPDLGDGLVRGGLPSALATAAGGRARRPQQHTGLQDVLIFENPTLGRVLVLDGIVQTSERDEFIYHEMMTHVPIIAHGAARDVLIIGGGDGGALEEALKHPGVARVTMVELDPGVVEIARSIWLRGIHRGAFDDPRAELLFADGVAFVAQTDRQFDVIILDTTDPMGAGQELFTEAFYADCRARLRPGGILAGQSGNPVAEPERVRACRERLGRVFADASFILSRGAGLSRRSVRVRLGLRRSGQAALERAELAPRPCPPGLRCYYGRGARRGLRPPAVASAAA